jgi:hypothetical protein
MALDHGKLLDDTISTLIDDTGTTVKGLEERVAEIVQSGSTNRRDIIGAYQGYADSMAQNAQNLREVSANTVVAQTESGIGTGLDAFDTDTENLLVEDAAGTIRENIMNHAETVTGLVVAGGLTGMATAELVQQTRGAVSGIMMSTGDPTTTRLQSRFAKMAADPNRDPKEFSALRKTIADRLPGIATSGSLSDTLKGVAESVVMRFDGAFTANRAKRNGVKRYQYAGGVVENTRPWCADLDGQILDEDTINDLWSESWQGKSGSNPFTDRGGYNCRHYWIPVEEDE